MSSANVAVVGFGTRIPANVLSYLAALPESPTITPFASPALTLSLSRPPYRLLTPVSNSPANDLATTDPTTFSLIIYSLPTAADYFVSSTTASFARSAALSNTPIIIINTNSNNYDPTATLPSASPAESLSALATLDTSAATILSTPPAVVIVVGSGGREHAIAISLAKSAKVSRVICCPGNGGTQSEGGKIVNASDSNLSNDSVIALTKSTNATLVMVGPEQPLVDGLVDALNKALPAVKVFGPTAAAAELENSKAFTKDFLESAGIRTSSYKTFTDAFQAEEYVKSLPKDHRVVVKASGLAAGKGVLIPETNEEAVLAVREIMTDKSFGTAGDVCVIERFITGPEASCLCFCDGETAKLMPPAQDHKRANDGDLGLNTGGMGAYCPAPCVTDVLFDEIEEMCKLSVRKMKENGTPYVGVLYAGLMLTPEGPSVLEFNCRFGDPETQVLLPLLETDLYEILVACCDGKLEDTAVNFKDNASAATVVCAAKGYPEKYPKDLAVGGIAAANEFAKVYHAGTKVSGDALLSSGGRVVAVTGVGVSLKDAIKNAYSGVSKVTFTDAAGNGQLHHRKDIAAKATKRKLRIGVMGSTRGTALVPVIAAIESGELHAEIVAVVSNKSAAPILDKGRALGPNCTTQFVSSKDLTRAQYDAECSSVMTAAGVDLVCLVGFMRILSPEFCRFWNNKCVNVHPSLLPKHGGLMDLEVHQAVLDAKEEESGCTIHYVTEKVDGGGTVVQKRVKVKKEDTAESLKSKVQVQEGLAYIEAIKKLGGRTMLTYADAGVDIVAGDDLVQLIKPACKSTRRPGCDADLGGFGGLFDLAAAGFAGDDVIIVGATDGVGTKLRVAQGAKIHTGVGVDLVAMCVNDLLVTGAEPLFFLDYYATGKLDIQEAAQVVEGIAEGCRQSGCGLIGGETAEMPSMYAPGDYDLGGFAVGAVRKGDVMPKNVKAGDILIGLPSSGVHSNGFSLVRKLLEKEGLSWDDVAPWGEGETVAENLLTPTKIYVKQVLPLMRKQMYHSSAHITGGGLLENLNRSIPSHIDAVVDFHPALTPVFKWMQEASGLDDPHMLKTFNCGVGMILVVNEGEEQACLDLLREGGEVGACVMGKLVGGGTGSVKCTFTLE